MSRTISFRDLLITEELSNIRNEIELLHPKHDHIVGLVLRQIGFDTCQEIEYIPSMHRDMTGKVAIGFQAVGEINTDRQYKKFLDVHDRIVAAGLKDISLAKDMAGLMGRSYSYNKNQEELKQKRKKAFNEDDFSEEELIDMGYSTGDNEDDYVEPDYKKNLAEIEQLNKIMLQVRGVQ